MAGSHADIQSPLAQMQSAGSLFASSQCSRA
jgi:hypothetical protein